MQDTQPVHLAHPYAHVCTLKVQKYGVISSGQSDCRYACRYECRLAAAGLPGS